MGQIWLRETVFRYVNEAQKITTRKESREKKRKEKKASDGRSYHCVLAIPDIWHFQARSTDGFDQSLYVLEYSALAKNLASALNNKGQYVTSALKSIESRRRLQIKRGGRTNRKTRRCS